MVLCVGAASTVIFQALRQPIVVGYLFAGMLVGPYLSFPLLANYDRIHTLSELGVILLMFALGLEFSIRKLLRLGPTSGFIMLIQVGLMLWLGFECGRAMHFSTLESIFVGAIVSISSTTIVAKAYEDRKPSHSLRGLVFGVLLMEDLAAVLELAVLTALATGAGVSTHLVGKTVARLAIFLVLLVSVGIIAVPRLIKFVMRLGRPETTLIACIGICFGFAIIAEHAGYSVALGAFLAGSLVAESGDVQQIEHLITPVRDMFGAVFFVSVGMMIDPTLIVDHWVEVIILTAVVVFGKVVGVAFASLLSGAGIKNSVAAGMSLAQIGEFSFIIAGVGLQLRATHEFIYTLVVAVSAITTLLTPFMIRFAAPISDAVAARFPEPVAALQSLYDSWMERIRSARADRAGLPSIRRPVIIIAFCAVSIAAILIFNEVDPFDFTGRLGQAAGWSYFESGIVIDLIVLVICAPFAMGLYYGSRRLATALAKRAIPVDKRATIGIEYESAGRALIEMLQLTILLGVVMPLLAVVQPFMEELEGVGILVIVATLMAIVVWRSARLMQGQMRAAVALLADSLTAGHALGQEPPHIRQHEVSGLGFLTAVRVDPDAPGVGQTIGQLDLQSTTGATVVAVARNGGDFAVPKSTEIIQAGDMVELAGSSYAIDAATYLLCGHRQGAVRTDLPRESRPTGS